MEFTRLSDVGAKYKKNSTLGNITKIWNDYCSIE